MIARIVTAASRRGGYMAMMGIGAVLGVLRGFVLAGILPADNFGFYAAVVAVGLFVAPLIGLGQIEEMRKRFPRLWVDGRFREITPIADRLMSIMATRAGIIVLVLGIGLLLAGHPTWALAVFAGGLVAFNQSGGAALASALRAGPDLTPMAAAALLRGISSFLLSIAGALAFGLNGAMIGEALGGLIGLFAARTMFTRMVRRHASVIEQQDATRDIPEPAAPAADRNRERRASRQGLQLLFGTLAISVPIYLTRPFVGVTYGLDDLGTFAFLMLFVQSVLTAVGITDQMIGPALVRMQHSGTVLARQIRTLFLYVAGIVALVALGLGLTFVLLTQSFLADYAAKYALTAELMLPIAVFAMLQVTSSLDWMLMAHDRESQVLRASLVYLAMFAVGTLFVVLSNQSLVVFLWVLAGAKAVQFATQANYIRAFRRFSAVTGSSSG